MSNPSSTDRLKNEPSRPLHRLPYAALTALIILQLIMLASLLAGVAPHPPRAIPLFAMGPFLGGSLALAAMALIVGPVQNGLGRALSALAALAALLSYGPQKYLDPTLGEIWPAVVLGQLSALVLLILVARPQLISRSV